MTASDFINDVLKNTEYFKPLKDEKVFKTLVADQNGEFYLLHLNKHGLRVALRYDGWNSFEVLTIMVSPNEEILVMGETK